MPPINDQLPERIPKDRWGLTLCKPNQQPCPVCQMYGDDKDTLKKIRDLYVLGVSPFAIGKVYEVPEKAIHLHGRRRAWAPKRMSPNRGTLKSEIEMLTRARVKEAWHLMNDQTADKALGLLAKVVGAVEDKVQIEGDIHNSFSWENMITRTIEIESGET